MHLPTVLFICFYPRKTYPPPVPVLYYLSLSGQIKHELEMCELRQYFENYCREIEAKYRHELEDTVLSSSRITRTLPAITRSLILPNYLVLWSRIYFFGSCTNSRTRRVVLSPRSTALYSTVHLHIPCKTLAPAPRSLYRRCTHSAYCMLLERPTWCKFLWTLTLEVHTFISVFTYEQRFYNFFCIISDTAGNWTHGWTGRVDMFYTRKKKITFFKQSCTREWH